MKHFVIYDSFYPAKRGEDTDTSYWEINCCQQFNDINVARGLANNLKKRPNFYRNIVIASEVEA